MTGQDGRLPTELRTQRLELRPFSKLDAAAVYAYARDPDWARFQQTTPASERDAERVVDELVRRDWETEPAWAVVRSGAVIGLVTLAFTAGGRIARLGYGIHAAHRGHGLTGEAIAALLDAAFASRPGLVRVMAESDARNHGSHRVLEKLCFTREGTLRSGALTREGELVDGAVHGLLRSEWEAR